MKRLLVPSAALLWGLQFAFLNPALALLLVALFNASPAEVGWVLAIYNASGFVASVLVPAYADRAKDYLRPMLACSVLTLVLAAVLAVSTSLPIAVVGLIVLGGPAGVGSSLLFAQLKHSGAGAADVMNTRAIVSFAWVAGPPLATFIMGGLGNRAILLALGAVAVLNVATTAAMISRRRAFPIKSRPRPRADGDAGQTFSKTGVAAVVVSFIALQATNSAAVSIMGLFVTQGLGVDVVGLTLFQRLIPRPGLASGLYTNTRRVGAIVSGPIIGLGSTTAPGYQGVFAACAALTVLALLVMVVAGREPRWVPPTERLAATAAKSGLDVSD